MLPQLVGCPERALVLAKELDRLTQGRALKTMRCPIQMVLPSCGPSGRQTGLASSAEKNPMVLNYRQIHQEAY
jgi:hypothetical protein